MVGVISGKGESNSACGRKRGPLRSCMEDLTFDCNENAGVFQHESLSIIQPGACSNAFGKSGARGYSVIRRRERGCAGGWPGCDGLTNTHCFPIVAKLLSTIETNNIGSVAIGACGHLMTWRQRKGRPSVRATKQRI